MSTEGRDHPGCPSDRTPAPSKPRGLQRRSRRADDPDLAVDLQALVDAGLVVFQDEPGRLRRYALTDAARTLAETRGTGRDRVREADVPEECPACRAQA